MTSKDLFKEMNNIDDNFIDEASDCTDVAKDSTVNQKFTGKKRFFTKKNIFRAAGALAVLCFVVCVGRASEGMKRGSGENETHIVAGNEHSEEDAIYSSLPETEIGIYEYRTDELVYFGGHMYKTCTKSNIITGETIEEIFLNKGTWLGKVENSKEYGESIYKDCPIYSVEGKKGTRQIIVEHEGELLLFSLSEFLYTPDMEEELRICGIFSAEDIQSVSLEWTGNYGDGELYESKKVIADKKATEELYNILVALSLDKDGYNAVLKSVADADLKEWKESGGDEVQTGAEGETFVSAYRGTTAFDNSVSIKLLSYDNEELTFSYYPKLEYMGFFKATRELVDWIAENQR